MTVKTIQSSLSLSHKINKFMYNTEEFQIKAGSFKLLYNVGLRESGAEFINTEPAALVAVYLNSVFCRFCALFQ